MGKWKSRQSCGRRGEPPILLPGAREKTVLKIRARQTTLGTISTPISISLADHLTAEERDQILQTVEMFEVITQANPDDYQSLEILKEAYWKIGRQEDGLLVTRRLADTYMRLGQYSSALLEYEGILQQEPDSREVQAILSELESKLHQGKSMAAKAPIALDFGIEDIDGEAPEPSPSPSPGGGAKEEPAIEPTLIATSSTRLPGALGRKQLHASLESDGSEPLVKFLIQHRLVSHEIVNAARAVVQERNNTVAVKEGQAVAASLLNEISKSGIEIETLLSGIIDRTKFAYMPLEYYDVDRQIVRMLPEHLTLGRLVVPFDIVSRTMMVAVDNPFDAGAKAAVQQMVDYHIQWHLSLPRVIQKILHDVYRIAE